MPRKPSLPKYSIRPYDQIAYVTIGGQRHLLGKDGEAARRRYSALCGRIAKGMPPLVAVRATDAADIAALVEAYMADAESYYNGSSEYACMLSALTPLVALYGDIAPDDFGPRCLVEIRKSLATSSGRVRSSINHDISRIKKFWRWASEHEHCDPVMYHKLKAVRGLRKGEFGVAESEPIEPARWYDINLILPFVSPTVGTMIQVQYLCGMRPQDVCQLCKDDIDFSGTVWMFAPGKHKNDWRGLGLVKAIPPRAQKLLAPYLKNEPYCFRPADGWLWWHSNRTDKEANTNRVFADRYSTNSYRRALNHGFEKFDKQRPENTPPIRRWSPNHLRHGILTEVSNMLGRKAAKEWAGHRLESTTEIYTSGDHLARVQMLAEIAQQLEAHWASCE